MNVVLICKCDLENKLIVNLVYKNLVNKYKKNIKIDLLFTNKEKAEFNSVFFEREKFNNVLFFEFSVNFYKQVKKEKYDKIIDISNSLKTSLLSLLVNSADQISTKIRIIGLLEKHLKKKHIHDPKIKSKEILSSIINPDTIDFNPDLKINSKQNNDLLKWIFETSTGQKFSKTNYVFIFYDYHSNNDRNLISEILNSINNSFKTKVILIVNSKNKNDSITIYEDLDSKLKQIVLKNFINCTDHAQIFLVLKNCKLFISNNKSLIHIFKFLSKNNYVEFKNDKKQNLLNLLIGIKKVNDRGYISKIVDSIEKINR